MLDIILIAVVVIAVVLGFSRGMLRTLFYLSSYVLALVGARMFGGRAAGWLINNTPVAGWVGSSLDERYWQNLGEESGEAVQPGTQWGASWEEFAENGLSGSAADMVFNSLGDIVVYYFLMAIGFLAVFLAVRVAVGFLGRIFVAGLWKSRILRGTDRLGGFVLGAVIGVLLVLVIVHIIIPFGFAAGSTTVIELARESRIAAFLQENSIYNLFADEGLQDLGNILMDAR